MQCPHCHEHFNGAEEETQLGFDQDGIWWVSKVQCTNSECNRWIFALINRDSPPGISPFMPGPSTSIRKNHSLIHPRVPNRQPIPPEVPSAFTEDYIEACDVLSESPKASAALSRRCLQLILHTKAGVNKGNLKREIDAVISSENLPSELAESLHTLREIGNFAAHPQHHQGTGEIVPVEPGEAEWCLEVIEMLFDFYFVRPADIERRRKTWEQKRDTSRGK